MKMPLDEAKGINNPEHKDPLPALPNEDQHPDEKPEALNDDRGKVVNIPPDICPRTTTYFTPQPFIRISHI